MIKKTHIFLSVLLAAGLLLAACGGGAGPSGGDGAPEATPSGGDTGGAGDSGGGESAPSVELNLDPANLPENAVDAAKYLYEGLVREQDGAFVGALAESYTVSEDGLDYIFTLRPNVSFHDGSSLNADAVMANFNRWFDPEDPNRGDGDYAAWVSSFGGFKGELKEDGKPKSWVDGMEKVDEFNVIIHLNAPDPDLLKKLTDPAFFIVSPAAFAGVDGGTGPYRAASNDGTTLVLEPFAGYWDPAAIPSEGMEVPAP